MYIYGSQGGKGNKIKSGLYIIMVPVILACMQLGLCCLYMVLNRFCRTPCPCAPIGCKFQNKGKGRASRCGFGTNMGALLQRA